MAGLQALPEYQEQLTSDRKIALSEIRRLKQLVGDLDVLLHVIGERLRERQPSGVVAPDVKGRKVKGTISLKDAVKQVFHEHPDTTLSVSQVWELAQLLGAQSDATQPTTVISSCIRRLLEDHSELQGVGTRGAYIWRSASNALGREQSSVEEQDVVEE